MAIVELLSVAFFLTGNIQTTELTPIQLANIEALATGERTPVGDCYISSPFSGAKPSKYEKDEGAHWFHEYDWNGELIATYHLQNPVISLWMDSSSDSLYGYDAYDDALYRMKIH